MQVVELVYYIFYSFLRTQSFFSVFLKIANQGEMALMRFLGHNEGNKRFEVHRKTFITEADIAEIGIKRIFVGFKTKISIFCLYS